MASYSSRRGPGGPIVVVLAVAVFGIVLLVSILRPGGPVNEPPTQTPTPAGISNSGVVQILFASALTKQDWVNAATESFNAAQFKTKSGRTIVVTARHVTSGGSKDDILAGDLQPAAWSPGDQSWVEVANQATADRAGRPLTSDCRPVTVYAPIGFGIWRPMAEALGWPGARISWTELANLAADPQGWGRYGHPEWGQFAFGHPHSVYSNFGMLMVAEVAYEVLGKTGGLTLADVKDSRVEDAMRRLELNTYHYGEHSRDLLDLMARRGPEYLHAVFTAEAEVLRANAVHGSGLRFPLAFVFPEKGTFWTEQPYCVLDGADWVDADQREAAAIYGGYLLDPEQQQRAPEFYLRPADTTIPLYAPITLENGTDPSVTQADVPPLASPSAEVQPGLIDLFLKTKKKATVVLVLDTSGSMQGDRIKSATAAAAEFVERLYGDDYVLVLAFNDQVTELQPSGFKRQAGDGLQQAIQGLFAKGNTALYDAVCQAAERVDALRAADEAAGDRRLYGIVVLSDGEDTASQNTFNDMLNLCLGAGSGEADVEGVKVFTIAYRDAASASQTTCQAAAGSDENIDELLRLANRNGGRCFLAEPGTIEKIYKAISAEQ